MRAFVVLALLLLVALPHCTPMRIETPHPPRGTHFGPGATATLVLTSLTTDMPGKARDPRYAEIPRRLGRRFELENTQIVEERDLTASAGPGTWLVRIRLTDLSMGASSDDNAMELEVTVHDASGAPLERVATDDGIVFMVDTTGRAPILRRTYEVELHVSYGSRASNPEEREHFDDEYAQITAELLYEQFAPDLARAIETATPYVQPIESVPSDGPLIVR